MLEVPQIIISVGYEAMRFAKFTVASFNFFWGWGGVGVASNNQDRKKFGNV